MKNKLILVAALAVSALVSIAQDANTGRPDRPPGGPGRGQRPASPIVVALDANKDGKIDATELANAVAALKTLDKNGDGELTMDELMPPGGPGGPGGREGGAGGPGRGGPRGPRPDAPQQ